MRNHVGVDLSKKFFDATLQDEQKQQEHAQFKNTPKGFSAFRKWLKKQGIEDAHICMEATNIYWEDLADYLHAERYTVSVVNPARIKGFGMSQMQRNKTDKVDSRVIVTFCAAMSPRIWQPPTETERKLRRLVRHRAALVKTQTQQKNRLVDCRDDYVRASLQTILATLKAQIKQVEAEISALIKQDPDLKEKKRLLKSILGFGDTSAHLIMAEMYDLAEYENAHAAAADAGVHPAHYESGDTVRKKSKMSKMGKSAVRGGIYMPAVTAIRSNPVIMALAQRLEAKGKEPMVIIGAAMRKLIHIAYGVLKNKTPFDPQWEKSKPNPVATSAI